ncbi:MAG: UDP-glucose 4-epimerase GalE, partial [Phycisphaerales bacterium]
MKVLCTGGAGYVGSACLRWLRANGHEAVAYDNLSLGHREAVGDATLIVGDIGDSEALSEALRAVKPDAVMHFAASTYVGESVQDPEHYYRNNIAGTLNLLSAMRTAKVQRMIFSSTCATYGESPVVPMNEDAPQEACSPYARTKLAVEWMIRDFCGAYGLGFTLLRYFNAAGAPSDGEHGEDHDPETHLIPLVLQVAMGQREKLLVFGNDYPTPDGTCIRDYIHVDDLAQAHLLAIGVT